MKTAAVMERARIEGWTDEEVVHRVLNGEIEAYEVIMRRYNPRLYRVALSILRDRDEAEDVVQDAFVRAYRHLVQFSGRAPFSSWLTRIAVNEALARSRRLRLLEPLEDDEGQPKTIMRARGYDPEQDAVNSEARMLLEKAILALPEQYRTVLMMRDIQEMDTAETAKCLDITEDNVKIRLHRARAMLRRELYAIAGGALQQAFAFDGQRCDRIVARVFERINEDKQSE